jgi:hypothetical protein
MTITRENYEVFFIDFIDGKLSPAEVKALNVFLIQNPDLAQELEDMKSFVLEPNQQFFPQKEALKRKEFNRNGIINEFDYLCIAEIENDLSSEEQAHLERIVTLIPELTKQRLHYSNAILIADRKIVYPEKPSLKRISVINIKRSTLRLAVSIAAGLTLLVGLFTVYSTLNFEKTVTIHASQEFPKPIESNEAEVFQKIEETATPVKPKRIISDQKGIDFQDMEPLALTVFDEEQEVETKREEIELKIADPLFYGEANLTKQGIPSTLMALSTPIEHKQIDEADRQEPKNEYIPLGNSRTIGFFELAQFGVKKIADFTGGSMELSAEKDPTGSIKTIRFESTLFAISKPINKK